MRIKARGLSDDYVTVRNRASGTLALFKRREDWFQYRITNGNEDPLTSDSYKY